MPLRKRTRWQRWWPFLLLCVVAAGRWAVSDTVPAAAPTALSLAIGCASAALLVLSVATLRRLPLLPARVWIASAIAGAMTLCGPFAGLLSRTRLEAASLTMALALVPVVIAVARPAFRQTEGAELAGRLWPGIVAVSGLLLLLPQPSLAGARSDIVLCVATLATGVGAAWFRTVSVVPLWRTLAALSGAAVVFLASAGLTHSLHSGELRPLALAAALDGAIALLSVAALLRIGMTRWSAQFVLVPLVILLEGLMMMRPQVDVRSFVGLALMVLASTFLLLPPKPDDPGEVVPK